MITRTEQASWALAVIACVVIPLALGYHDLALAGAGGLGILWWRVQKSGTR